MNDVMFFTVLGEPTGKGRPKFARAGNYVRTYTPEKTERYENIVRLEYQNQCGGLVPFGAGIPLRMEITAIFRIPQSKSKKEQAKMEAGTVRPCKKPDMDNIAKIICDALNQMAYYDDSQIVELELRKLYGLQPRTDIKIERIINL